MGLGRRTCHAARWSVLIAALTATSGCRWLPVHQVDPTIWPGRSETEPSDYAPPETELPQLPALSPVSDREALAPVAARAPAPTPILDAAWERVQAAREQARPASTPATTIAASPEAGSTQPKSPNPDAKSPVDDQITRAAATIKAPASPWEDWKTGLERLRAIAHDRAQSESDAGGTWNLRERLLLWMAGASQDNEGELWQFVLSALASPIVHATAPDLLRPEPLARDLRPDSPTVHPTTPEPLASHDDDATLKITEIQLCRRVLGFGSYEPSPSNALTTGEPTLLYWEVIGPSYEGTPPHLRSRLRARLELVPADGGEPVWRQDLGTIEDSCRRPRRDFYMNYRLILPKTLAAGEFRLRVTLRDEISGRQVEQFTPLSVHSAQ